jgi:hypothetical protein
VAARDRKLAGPLLAHALWPSVRRREEARAAVLAALRPGDGAHPGRSEARAYRRNWRVNAGAHALPRNPAFVEPAVAAVGGDTAGGPAPGGRWKCKPENALYLRRLLTLATARGVPVFWLLPTVSPATRDAHERDGRTAAFLRFVRGLQREFPGLTVLDPRPVLGDPSLFSDTCHVDRLGAAVLSASVAEAVGRSLSPSAAPAGVGDAPRWVELIAPGGLVAEADATVEDVSQSAARLRGGVPEPEPEPARVARRAARAL